VAANASRKKLLKRLDRCPAATRCPPRTVNVTVRRDVADSSIKALAG